MKALKSIARRMIPSPNRALFGAWLVSNPVLRCVKRIIYFGKNCFCPCCRSHLRRFHPFGVSTRLGAKCPVCHALERHRLIYLYFERKTDLFDANPKTILHVAPEPQLSRLIRRSTANDYLSADLSSPLAMVKMDITQIQYAENSFDVIYCSHVLEHVPDDRRAMAELFRVLRPGGWAIIQVPISEGETVDGSLEMPPDERERLFGQTDHVRRYGKDYKNRLEQAGFLVTVDSFVREFNDNQIKSFGLLTEEDIYFCEKRCQEPL